MRKPHFPLKSAARVGVALIVVALGTWAYGQYSEERAFRARNPTSLTFCSEVKPGTIPATLRERASLAGARSAQLANGAIVVMFPHEQPCFIELAGGFAAKAYVPKQD